MKANQTIAHLLSLKDKVRLNKEQKENIVSQSTNVTQTPEDLKCTTRKAVVAEPTAHLQNTKKPKLVNTGLSLFGMCTKLRLPRRSNSVKEMSTKINLSFWDS